MKYPKLKKRFLTVCLLGAAMGALQPVLTGCVADVDANSKSISDYKDSDVKSYGDLFEVFWSVMNQRYCDLNEHSDASSLDWDQVYSEYKPKFEALKSFRATSDYTQEEIQADNAKAQQYFQEIVGKVLDQHFRLKVTLPVSHASQETVSFRSSLRERGRYVPLDSRWVYTNGQLKSDTTSFGDITSDGFCILGGFLKDAPDTYYLGFNSFSLTANCSYAYHDDYLPTNAANAYHLDQQKIAAKAGELVASQEKRTQVEQEAVALLATVDQYLASSAVTAACGKMMAYSNEGDYYGMADSVTLAVLRSPGIIKSLPVSKDVSTLTNVIKVQMARDNGCKTICTESSFCTWLSKAMAEYLLHEREFYAFWSDVAFTYKHSCVETYRRRFLEPLAEGKIQKLILDLRGNTGGSVADTRLLTDFLVNRTATFCYMRKKEDNNPYSYTPWVPQQIVVTSSSLGRDIPTVVLIDNYSASMSEITSLILKSQGDHVKTVGRNSYGAQCMLVSDNSSSNGGWQGNVTSYLWFYMPVVLTKDVKGNILESVGITPDYAVEEMSQEEVGKIQQNSADARDRDLEKALEILR